MDVAIIMAPWKLGLSALPFIETNVPVQLDRGPVRRYTAARPMPGLRDRGSGLLGGENVDGALDHSPIWGSGSLRRDESTNLR